MFDVVVYGNLLWILWLLGQWTVVTLGGGKLWRKVDTDWTGLNCQASAGLILCCDTAVEGNIPLITTTTVNTEHS